MLDSRPISCVRNSELAARAILVVHDLLELIEMARQSNDLLGNVGPLGEDRHFAYQILGIELDVHALEQARLRTFQQPIAEQHGDLRNACSRICSR